MGIGDLYSVTMEREPLYVDAACGEDIYHIRLTVRVGSVIRGRFFFIETTAGIAMNIFSEEDSRTYIGAGYAAMQAAFFGGLDDKKMALYFVSRYVGKRKGAERIFWLDSIEGEYFEAGTAILRVALKKLEPRVMRSGGMMVFGEYSQWPEMGRSLDLCKMRLIEGTIYRVGLKVDREFFGKFGVKYVRI